MDFSRVQLSDDDAARIEELMSGVAGRVDVFRPFNSAMEVWS